MKGKMAMGDESITVLRSLCEDSAIGQYGNPLPKLVQGRLYSELDNIGLNGYAGHYLSAAEKAKEAKQKGYRVRCKFAAGASLAAFFAGITNVNPLPAHYYCSACAHFETATDTKDYKLIGYDLPDKACPLCGKSMKKDGFNLALETFTGYSGDKEPEFELVLSEELRELESHTKDRTEDIRFDDKKIIDAFGDNEYGIMPQSFSDIVSLMALDTGSGVWDENLDKLTANSENSYPFPATRDDLLYYLEDCGIERKSAYLIMEKARKGQGITADMQADMEAADIPDKCIDFCKKVKYLPSKADAAGRAKEAYLMAHYQVYHPTDGR